MTRHVSNPHDSLNHTLKRQYKLLGFQIGFEFHKLSSSI
jgi:hypothetical protein